MIGSLALTPRRRRVRLNFRVQDQNVRTADFARDLSALHREHRGPILVVLDRLNVHRAAVKQIQARGAPWLSVEWLAA